ncbi:hypothetical protein FOZ62_000814 [Perkinsus olseni]|uniref:Uncharacterized protein n=1 Tax=Perkinsus olseni TaxID=32597 RepID=A0A7J6T8H9_PEROL|nr:hypothetical protein FOZ62_000814 [Perkinsus olseni]
MGKKGKNYYKRKGLGGDQHHQSQGAEQGQENQGPSGWRYDSRGDKPTFQSDAFDEYYNTQALLPPEEWKKTVECLRTPLPTSFRVMDLGVSSEIVKEQAKKFQEEISKLHPGQFQELPFVKDGYQDFAHSVPSGRSCSEPSYNRVDRNSLI